MATKKSSKASEPTFSKNKLLSSKRFCTDKVILMTVMPDDAKWSIDQAEKEITKFLDRKVD